MCHSRVFIVGSLIAIVQFPSTTMAARHYDPDQGRWMQRDPAGYVDGLNEYEYVRSRPTLMLDPIGTKLCGPATGSLSCWMKHCASQYDAVSQSGKSVAPGRITDKLLSCIACQETSFNPCADHEKATDHGLMGLNDAGAFALCKQDGTFFEQNPDTSKDAKTKCCGWDKQPVCEMGDDKKPKEKGPCAKGCEKSVFNAKNQICCAARFLQNLRDSVSHKVEQGELICLYHWGGGTSGRQRCENDGWKNDPYTTDVLECLGNIDSVKPGPKVVWPPPGASEPQSQPAPGPGNP